MTSSVQPPLLTRLGSMLFGIVLWILWLWMLIPSPVPSERLQQIGRLSAAPSLHVLLTLGLSYAVAVIACRIKKKRPAPEATQSREKHQELA
jgi:hypothetical protein